MVAIREILWNMWNSFSMVSIMDVLDILIVAFLIYKLITLLQKSNALQVVRGILLILIFAGLSSLFRLHVLSFIFSNTLQLGFLALIIVFQPELRRMLEQVGRSKFPSIFDKQATGKDWNSAIMQTVDACSSISWKREGALIVFERRVLLDDIINTGTIINSDVSSELLKNIFYPKAPLHDGAVVVRNGRVASAGCMLPLSNNINLSRDLGMRHRAAVGMSENSDAVIVVVSEETGSISVAQDGMLKRHLAPETLEMILRQELMPNEKDTKRTGLFSFLKNFKDIRND